MAGLDGIYRHVAVATFHHGVVQAEVQRPAMVDSIYVVLAAHAAAATRRIQAEAVAVRQQVAQVA